MTLVTLPGQESVWAAEGPAITSKVIAVDNADDFPGRGLFPVREALRCSPVARP